LVSGEKNRGPQSHATVPLSFIQVRSVYENVIMVQYEKLKKVVVEDSEGIFGFLQYFERTYLGRKLGQSLKKARFPIPTWNHYDSILEGASVTNNVSEGSNSAWVQSLPTNASLWTVLATFRQVRLH